MQAVSTQLLESHPEAHVNRHLPRKRPPFWVQLPLNSGQPADAVSGAQAWD